MDKNKCSSYFISFQLIVLSVLASSYAAKLDRTYLPPASAATAGGDSGSLTVPSGPAGFGPSSAGFKQSGSVGFGRSSGAFNQQSARPDASGPTGFGQTRPQGQAAFVQTSGSSGFGQSGQSGPTGPTGVGQTGPQGQAAFVKTSGSSGFGQSGQSGSTGSSGQGFGQTKGFGQASSGFDQTQGSLSGVTGFQPQRAQANAERNAEILRYDNQNDGETFSYSFETSNGISAEESGVATNGVQAQGGYSYSDDDGQTYRITYTADENGYVPQGDHLPTPHPIPEEILRSIEQNARAAAAGTQEGNFIHILYIHFTKFRLNCNLLIAIYVP